MKKVSLMVVMIVLSILLTSCDFSEHGALFDDEEKMMALGDTYSFLGKVETHDSISFQRFSGIYTIQSFTIDGPFTIDIKMNMSKGQFKVILVSEEDGIIEVEEGLSTITLIDHQVRLRMVGNDAAGSLDFNIQTSNDVNKKGAIRLLFHLYQTLNFNNRICWADFLACTTVNANIFIDDINVAFRNAIDWAFRLASAASDTNIGNSSWHRTILHTCGILLF